MRRLLAIEQFLRRIVYGVGRFGAWMAIPLMLIIVLDVVTRRFLVLGSTKLQEAEWHLHAILFLLCIGFAYLKDAHVRIDLVRERLSRRRQQWIEFIGCLVFVIPYCVIVVYFAEDFVERSWNLNEASDSATGLPFRWAIKVFLPIGLFVLLLSGICVLIRKFIQLFGPPGLHEIVAEEERRETEGLEHLKKRR